MRYLLDTNLIIEAVGASEPAVNALERAVHSEWVGYSAISRLELFGYPDLTVEEDAALLATVRELDEVAVTGAKARLNKLVERAVAGEDVILMKGSRHVAAIVSISEADLEISARLSDAQAERLWERIDAEIATGRAKEIQSAEEILA